MIKLRKTYNKEVDNVFNDVQRVLNDIKSKLDKFNIVKDDQNQLFLEITGNEGTYSSVIDVFQPKSGERKTILGESASFPYLHIQGLTKTGNELYTQIGGLKKFQLTYNHAGNTNLFVCPFNYRIDQITIHVVTPFGDLAKLTLSDGTNTLLDQYDLTLGGNLNMIPDIHYKYTTDTTITSTISGSPLSGELILAIKFSKAQYEVV